MGDHHGIEEAFKEVVAVDRPQGVSQGQEGQAKPSGERGELGGAMAKDSERGSAKPKMPEGATNLHKNMAVGMERKSAEDKATTESQVERKER